MTVLHNIWYIITNTYRYLSTLASLLIIQIAIFPMCVCLIVYRYFILMVCIYTYMCIYVYVFMYIYIYIYIRPQPRALLRDRCKKGCLESPPPLNFLTHTSCNMGWGLNANNRRTMTGAQNTCISSLWAFGTSPWILYVRVSQLSCFASILTPWVGGGRRN